MHNHRWLGRLEPPTRSYSARGEPGVCPWWASPPPDTSEEGLCPAENRSGGTRSRSWEHLGNNLPTEGQTKAFPRGNRTARPSSRSAWLQAHRAVRAGSGEAVERTDLDLAPARLGPLGRELERHVEVGRVDDPETPDDLLGLEVGAVGHHRRLTHAVDDGRRRCRLKPTGEDPVAIGVKLLIEGAGRGERLLHLLLGAVTAELVPFGGAVHGQQVVRHPSSPQVRAVPMTTFYSHHERHPADTTICHRRPCDGVPQRPTVRAH